MYTGSEHVKSRVSAGSIHVVPFVNSQYSVDKLGVQTHINSSSEHVKSRVSIGLIHILPNVNSRDSVTPFPVKTCV